jgi:hypothetical protein
MKGVTYKYQMLSECDAPNPESLVLSPTADLSLHLLGGQNLTIPSQACFCSVNQVAAATAVGPSQLEVPLTGVGNGTRVNEEREMMLLVGYMMVLGSVASLCALAWSLYLRLLLLLLCWGNVLVVDFCGAFFEAVLGRGIRQARQKRQMGSRW